MTVPWYPGCQFLCRLLGTEHVGWGTRGSQLSREAKRRDWSNLQSISMRVRKHGCTATLHSRIGRYGIMEVIL